MKRTILSITLALCVGCAFAQKNVFAKLAQIKGVEHVNINKTMLNMVAKNGGDFDFSDNLSLSGMSGDVLKKIENIRIYNCEEKDGAETFGTQVKRILSGRGWEPLLVGTDEDGEKYNISQFKKGKKSTIAIFHEGEEETALVVFDGEVDFAQLMEQGTENAEKGKSSLSIKTQTWEGDDDDEKEPRKFRDCLIVIDGKIYPNLHTQDEAARYMTEHNMDWGYIPSQVLQGKEVKKKYPGSKKKVAFEYTTIKRTQE